MELDTPLSVTRIGIDFNSSNSSSLREITATPTAVTVKKLLGNSTFDLSRIPGV